MNRHRLAEKLCRGNRGSSLKGVLGVGLVLVLIAGLVKAYRCCGKCALCGKLQFCGKCWSCKKTEPVSEPV